MFIFRSSLYLYLLGWVQNMAKRIYTNEEVETVIKLFLSGMTITDIYKITKINYRYGKRILEENGFKTPTKFKYTVDHFIFNEINNEEKAYWLGFLFADGYVRKRKTKNIFELKLKISIKDESHLIEFKKFLKSTHPITKQISKVKYKEFISISECVSLSVYSKQIFDDLCRLGCTPNKSIRIGKPNISDEYFSHFIRGYFDGDGCVSMGKEGKNRMISFTSASTEILKWINTILYLNNASNKDIIKRGNIYTLRYFNQYDLELIYSFLYKDATLFLNRKKHKYAELLGTYKHIKIIQKQIDGSIIKKWNNISVASRNYKVSRKTLLKCCDGKINYVRGYKWEYDK